MPCPKVTVILTSFNHEAFLAKSIESILNQTFVDFELVIIDDASIDSSQEIIRKYAQKDPRITYIFHEENLGKSNFLDHIQDYNGEYVAIAHSDDMWMPSKLEKQVAFLDFSKEHVACFTGVEIIGDDDEVILGHRLSDEFVAEDKSRFEWLRHFFFKSNAFCHPSLLIRKSAYGDYDLDPVGLSGLPDMYNWIRVLLHSEVKVLPDKLTLFRVHADESNTSGISLGSLNRATSETFLVLQQFLSIESTDELLAIFPEAREYIVDGEYSKEYIIAMMALRAQRPQFNMFAIRILFDLLQDAESSRKLESLYGFTNRVFTDIKLKCQTFPIPYKFYAASVYLGETEGSFSEEDKLSRAYAMTEDESSIILRWNTEGYSGKRLFVRFDPLEGEPIICKLKSFKIDGKDYRLVAHNSSRSSERGYEFFYNQDPIYLSNSRLELGDSLEVVFDISIIDKLQLISELEAERQSNSLLNDELNKRLSERIKRKLNWKK